MAIKVLFVCLGNICRSPTAQGVFERKVVDAGLQKQIEVDSAGTGDWHIGHQPDQRAAAAAARRGYPLDHLRARQVTREDFGHFDYILAMDRQNLRDLRSMAPADYPGQLDLFLPFAVGDSMDGTSMGDSKGDSMGDEVPDPYYGGDSGFDDVLDRVEAAADGLLAHIRQRL